MRIKMIQGFAGEWTCSPGDVIERPEAEAARLIDAGFAVPVRDDAAPVETADADRVVETTSRRRR